MFIGCCVRKINELDNKEFFKHKICIIRLFVLQKQKTKLTTPIPSYKRVYSC